MFCYDKYVKEYFDNIFNAKIIFVCVPTPSQKDGSCDISIVESTVARFANSDKIIVVKSTVPPGTCEKLSKRYNINFFLFNPEYLTEAQAWKDFSKPDRQIVAPVNDTSKWFCSILLELLPLSFFRSPGVEIPMIFILQIPPKQSWLNTAAMFSAP